MSFIYLLYAIVHLHIFNMLKTEFSNSTILHEAQYIVNYTFMILNLFVYTYAFKDNDTSKIKESVIISLGIYIISTYVSIFTGTSSTTYIEGTGYKGLFESGNSLGAIFTLGLFIIIPTIVQKKKWYYFVLLLAIGIFLSLLIGTRVGLYGFLLVLGTYAISEITISIIKKKKINKYLLLSIIIGVVIIVTGIVVIGSKTLERRRHLKDIEGDILDNTEESHISGSLLKIKNEIESGNINENQLSIPAQKSIIDLYEYANKHNVINNDMRTQQLIYNFALVKNQANPILLLFGNGYMINYRELVFEMELLSLLTNFGLIGFAIYALPLIIIFIYSCYFGIKNITKIDTEYLMLLRRIIL